MAKDSKKNQFAGSSQKKSQRELQGEQQEELEPDGSQGFSAAIEKADERFAGAVLGRSLKGEAPSENSEGQAEFQAESKKEKKEPSVSLDFDSTDPAEEGRLIHFLRQLARLCHLRGDMIPPAQEKLLQKFFLNRRDRHHLKQMSNAHALRSEGALKDGNVKLALLERIEAWNRMPRDLSLLLDVTEAYIEPESFAEQWSPSFQREERLSAEAEAEAELQEKGQEQEGAQEARGKKRSKRWFAKDRRKKAAFKRRRARKGREKAARHLFQLSVWQHHKKALAYLKKAVELSIGLRDEGAILEAGELTRLAKLQEHYPKVNWQRYTERIRALKGRPRRKWPWVLLGLLFLALLYIVVTYLPWRAWGARWFAPQVERELEELELSANEQQLLLEPVPVEWDIAPERDESFAKQIQKSQRLKLAEFYAYEVQGQIRVKPKDSGNLVPTEPFQLFLDYEHQGKKYQKTLAFSYSAEDDPNDVDRALVLEGDTVLFRQVFRLPPDGPAVDDVLRAKVATMGPAPSLDAPFEVALPSVDMSGREVPQLQLALRQKLERSDGVKLRMLGYDLTLRNASQRPLDFLSLRLNWTDDEGPQAQAASPVLLQRNYTIVSPSGTDLPGASQTTQRLWVELPEDLNYAPEDWTPQVRILDFGYRE